MSALISTAEARELIESRFSKTSISLQELSAREYPEETVFIARVSAEDMRQAAELGVALDGELQARGFRGFITIRPVTTKDGVTVSFRPKSGVQDGRTAELIALVSARARTSEAQPSLAYVPDAVANLAKVTAARHSLIFGRRGAGKTALMLEAKERIKKDGNLVVWLNLQTFRRESVQRIALWILSRLTDELLTAVRDDSRRKVLLEATSQLRSEIERLLGQNSVAEAAVTKLVPRLQSVVKRYCDSSERRLYIFLDDVHYVPRAQQPDLLDLLHACVRDSDAWLKIATIRHFSKWYRNDPPTGLQAGQDADAIDLDLTLQDPQKAKIFLEAVLAGFAGHVGISPISALFAPDALERLVLASGAVPRDYLVLAAGSLSHAREREGTKHVGKQDVTRAAGEIAKAKLAELEDDTASDTSSSRHMLQALQLLRDFCLVDRKFTFFQIDFKDKEKLPTEYGLLQSLMDVRLIHMVNSSVSDTHRSGERSEVYILDLSQFSGERLKKYLRVLDFSAGHIVLKETGTDRKPRIANTPRRLITILRSAPEFALSRLSAIIAPSQGARTSRSRRRPV